MQKCKDNCRWSYLNVHCQCIRNFTWNVLVNLHKFILKIRLVLGPLNGQNGWEWKFLESLDFSIINITLPWPSGVTYVPHQSFFVVVAVNIPFFRWFFRISILSSIKFPVLYNISIFLSSSMKYPARSTSRKFGHEARCDKGQLCELFTDSLALFYIQCKNILRFFTIYPCICSTQGLKLWRKLSYDEELSGIM